MGELERAITEITREGVRVVAASRTDTGVHALGQVVSFHTHSALEVGRLQRGLNAVLPDDLAVRHLAEVPDAFHARFSARGKHYRYRILNTPTPSPLEADRAWHLPGPLDLEAMREAAAHLVGEHDFTAFGGGAVELREGESNVRRLVAVEVGRGSDPIAERGAAGVVVIDVVGDRFLYKMVRTIAGTLVLVGQGKLAPGALREIIQSGQRRRAGPTAPPEGLFLIEVFYDEDALSNALKGFREGVEREHHHHGSRSLGPRRSQGIRGAEGKEARALL